MKKKIGIVAVFISFLLIITGVMVIINEKQAQKMKEDQTRQKRIQENEQKEISEKGRYPFETIALPEVDIKNDAIVQTIERADQDASEVCAFGNLSVGISCGPEFSKYNINFKESINKKIVDDIKQPQVSIYPLPEYKIFTKTNGHELALKAIESTESLPDNSQIKAEAFREMFPVNNAAGGALGHEQFIRFNNGYGIRAVYYYSQSYDPPAQGNFFYHFQGMTKDHKYLVVVDVPLSSAKLETFLKSIQKPEPNYDKADHSEKDDFDIYIDKAFQNIREETPQGFEPDLTALDFLVQSIKINEKVH